MPSEAQVTKSAIDRLKSAIQAKRKADKALVSLVDPSPLERTIRASMKPEGISLAHLLESTRTIDSTLRRKLFGRNSIIRGKHHQSTSHKVGLPFQELRSLTAASCSRALRIT